MELDDSIAALFANRAACHLQLGMLQQCAADCDRALALAPPPAGPPMPDDGEGGAEARAAAKSRRMAVKVLCRRAQARAQSGDAEGALVDLERALALDPGNEEIRRSAEDAAMARGTQVREKGSGGVGLGYRRCEGEREWWSVGRGLEDVVEVGQWS